MEDMVGGRSSRKLQSEVGTLRQPSVPARDIIGRANGVMRIVLKACFIFKYSLKAEAFGRSRSRLTDIT